MHTADSVIFYFFVIFTGSAIFATIALYARQTLLIGYIVLGIIVGPPGIALVSDTALITAVSDIGIIFLLFLLGLNLHPQDLLRLLRKTMLLTLVSSFIFALLGFVIGQLFNFNLVESMIIGVSAMFSSTIIGLKLLPTTVLHHRRAGEIMISILLLQDLFAIIALLILQGGSEGDSLINVGLLIIELPLLIAFAFFMEHYILIRLIRRFDKIQEYIFLLTIGWCLGMAELATALGLSHEIGAFIGGVALATNPITRFIAESLKPLRDFFLVMFFFSLGAKLELNIVYTILLPATVLATTLLLVKPWVFRFLLIKLGETTHLALEMGVRLGQVSEFSLLVAVVALNTGFINQAASYLIQATTLITFIISSYFIVMHYPTPIAISDKLRRD